MAVPLMEGCRILNCAKGNMGWAEGTYRDVCIDGEGKICRPLARVRKHYSIWINAQSKDLFHLLGRCTVETTS